MRKFRQALAVVLAILMIASIAMVSVSAEEMPEIAGTGTNFYVVGSAGLCGADWAWADPTGTDTEMDLVEGIYVKEFKNVAAGTYNFKVIEYVNGNATWHPDGGGNDSSVTVEVAGSTVVVTLDLAKGAPVADVILPEVDPASSETGPASSETDPASSETGPASSETDPASSETGPASSETDPASSETDPASSETDPASSETDPASSETDPASSEADVDTTPDPEGETTNYYVVGDAGLCGDSWAWADPTGTDTQMTLTTDGNYVKVFRNVAAGTYSFKVVEYVDGAVTWHPDGKGNDSSITVERTGSTVVVTLVPTGTASNDKAEAEITFRPAGEEPSSSETTPSEVVPATYKTIKYADTQNWDAVYVHYWNDGGMTTTWPGTLMTATDETKDGFKVYTAQVDVTATEMIFNNGDGTQLPNAAFDAAVTGYVYDAESEAFTTWTEEEPSSSESTPASSETTPTTPVTPTPAKISVAKCTVTGLKTVTYKGKAIKLSVKVKKGSTVLKEKTDYTVSYKNNTNAGKATVTITGKGSYTGTLKKTFTIAKAANKMKVSAKALKVKVNAKKTTFKASKAFSVTKAKGAVSYKQATKNKYIAVSKKGVVTVKKGLKKNKSYTFKVKVSAKGDKNYKAGSKTVKVTVKVK